MVHQYHIETNLLQLFAQPENSQGFSTTSVVIFVVKLLLNKKKYN